MTLCQQCEQLLDELEQVLESYELLQSTPPSPKRLASTEPFAVDTLACHEWLQWIFFATDAPVGVIWPVTAKQR